MPYERCKFLSGASFPLAHILMGAPHIFFENLCAHEDMGFAWGTAIPEISRRSSGMGIARERDRKIWRISRGFIYYRPGWVARRMTDAWPYGLFYYK